MSIKVNFNTGERTLTVGGLYQWDYGQILEIECTELGTELMEVHFACSGMSEAIVRSCQFVEGIGTVTIPDQCLEQTSNITAWVYSISASQGHTVKAIILPVTGRMRPSALRDIPPEYINKYAEAIEEINEAVNAIEKGNITAAKAVSATTAKSADTARNAESATYATSAGSASAAATANSIEAILAGSCEIKDGAGTAPDAISFNTIYLVRFEEISATYSGVCCWNLVTDANSCSLGECVMSFSTSGGKRNIAVLKDGANYGNGTLKFYKLGGVSA